jgi:hypothetical protein
MAWVSHSSISVTMHNYSSVLPGMQREAVEKLASMMESLGAKSAPAPAAQGASEREPPATRGFTRLLTLERYRTSTGMAIAGLW